jgi:hypothetical protein
MPPTLPPRAGLLHLVRKYGGADRWELGGPSLETLRSGDAPRDEAVFWAVDPHGEEPRSCAASRTMRPGWVMVPRGPANCDSPPRMGEGRRASSRVRSIQPNFIALQASRSSPESGLLGAASLMTAPRPASFAKKLGNVLRTQPGSRRRIPGTRKPSMPKHIAMR